MFQNSQRNICDISIIINVLPLTYTLGCYDLVIMEGVLVSQTKSR